jgi:uncharacterized protein (TIGR02246 family)
MMLGLRSAGTKVRIARTCLALVFVLLAGCAKQSPRPAVNLAAEEAEVRATDTRWQEAVKARDAERAAAFWADDATIYPPNAPAIIGKDAIHAYVAGAFASPDFSITWTTDKVEVAKAGDMAYSSGSDQITYRGEGNKLVSEKTHGVVVWKKQANGLWRAEIDIWNADVPPASAAKKK